MPNPIASTTRGIDWPDLVLSEASMKAFNTLAVKRFREGPLAEESVTFVIEALASNDWQKCKAFEGKCKATTFLYALASNLIEEFSRQRFGRPRPPTWLKQQGEIWVSVWRLLCIERQLLPSILDRLSSKHLRERSFLEDIARVIQTRLPNCGLSTMDHETTENIEETREAQEQPHTEEGYFSHQQSTIDDTLMILKELTDGKPIMANDSSSTGAKIKATADKLKPLRDTLCLNDEERVLLRMVYAEGLSKSAAAAALGLPRHQANRTINTALERLKVAITGSGADLSDLLAAT